MWGWALQSGTGGRSRAQDRDLGWGRMPKADGDPSRGQANLGYTVRIPVVGFAVFHPLLLHFFRWIWPWALLAP